MSGIAASRNVAAPRRWASFGAALAILLVGCGEPENYADSKYVYRAVESPDGGSTARLARVAGGGAAGYLFYDVYLSNNTADGAAELVFRGYSDCDPGIEWRGSQLLLIRYAGASCRVQTFHSPWEGRELERGRKATTLPSVEIMLERVGSAEEAGSPPNNSLERTREK
jgi:hypothetical protein